MIVRDFGVPHPFGNDKAEGVQSADQCHNDRHVFPLAHSKPFVPVSCPQFRNFPFWYLILDLAFRWRAAQMAFRPGGSLCYTDINFGLSGSPCLSGSTSLSIFLRRR
jgi:hypothetical protein